ncbi:MAG: hypothetical protein ABEI06_05455 [Halobacteriaceae archaeon]
MSASDRIGTVIDERGDVLEIVFWAGVFLFTLLLFAWEFGIIGVLEAEKAGKFPIAFIVDFSQSMYLTALLGGGGVVLLIIIAILRFGVGVRDTPSPLNPGQGTFKFMIYVLGVTAIVGMTIFQGAATLAQTDEASPAEAADDIGVRRELEMSVIAAQWFWRFHVEGVPFTQGDRVVLPADTIIQFQTTSADVIHSFAIKSLGITKDAIPGQVNQAWFYVGKVKGERTLTFTTVGGIKRTVPADVYQVRCAELCGKGHSKMIATILIIPLDDYRAWVRAQGGFVAITRPDKGIIVNETKEDNV